MRSPASLAPLSVELQPSRLLQWVLLGAGATGSWALTLTALPWLVLLMLGGAMLLYLLTLGSRHTGWPGPLPWRVLQWDGRQWLLRHHRRGWLAVELRESLIWPGVTALRFRGPGRRSIRLLLARDALSPESRRRLHLHLRTLLVHGPGR